MELRFPFGQPVLKCAPKITEPRKVFVLGAYPSALHVSWCPPAPYLPVRAIPVDNEPDVFWNGTNEQHLISDWMSKVGFDTTWGVITPAARFNGSSGLYVDHNVLKPLGASRNDAWMTDCLDTYRCSSAVADRLQDTYIPAAQQHRLPSCRLLQHPSEDEIVREATAHHKQRLMSEIEMARPDRVVTLGNAALRVLRECVEVVSAQAPRRLSPASSVYGKPLLVKLSYGGIVEWLPLAHPAAPQIYQEAHKHWMSMRE